MTEIHLPVSDHHVLLSRQHQFVCVCLMLKIQKLNLPSMELLVWLTCFLASDAVNQIGALTGDVVFAGVFDACSCAFE